jgi:hypothetical protein
MSKRELKEDMRNLTRIHKFSKGTGYSEEMIYFLLLICTWVINILFVCMWCVCVYAYKDMLYTWFAYLNFSC